MRKTKYVFPAFTFYDRTGIRDFLEKQAREGWMLEKMGGFGWIFRRIEPKNIHFAVTYFPKASAFDPEPSEQQKMFQEFCAHSGWKLVAPGTQIQIFYNEAESPVPIETDPMIELENIHRAAKKTFLPVYFMELPVVVMMFLSVGMQWKSDPISLLTNSIYAFNILCGVIILLMCGVELIGYFRWYARAKKVAQESGEFVATKGTRTFQLILVSILSFSLFLLICFLAEAKIAMIMLISLVLIVAVCLISVGATALMKRMKVSAKVNRTVTMILTVVLSFCVLGVVIARTVFVLNDWDREQTDAVTYEWHGETWTLYREDIPLTIQDMMNVDPEIYSYHWSRQEESLFAARNSAYQRPRYDMLDQPDLSYTIVEVKADIFYNFCLEMLLAETDDDYTVDDYGNKTYEAYKIIDETPWGANKAYGLYWEGEFRNEYLLCYDDCIVLLDPDWEMTEEQMATVGAIFD